MKHSPQHEQELLARALAFKDDPVGFVHFMYPWGQAGTPLANFKGPRPWQLDQLAEIAEHTRNASFTAANGLPLPSIYRSATSSGRGPGKSAVFGMVAHWHISTHIGGQTIVAANTETQLRKKTFPEMSRWFTMALNSHWFLLEGMQISPDKWLAELVRDQLHIDPGYWNVVGQTWNEDDPDSFAGAHNSYGLAVLFDEASGIPAGIWDTADGFFTDPTPYRYHMAASQMRRNRGRFYEIFHDKRFADWKKRKLSIRGMEGVSQQWVNDFIARHGEGSDEVRIEIDGDAPNTDEGQFISTADVRIAQSNEHTPDPWAPLIMGVDPAPRGRTVIRFRQGRNARDCCGRDTRVVLEGADNNVIAAKVAELVRRWNPDAVCVDFGQGTGVIDILKARPYNLRVTEVRFGESPVNKDSEWATRSIELWGDLRDWLPGGMIDKSDELFRDLTQRGWEWSGREDGKKVLEKKEALRSRGIPSPDDADALACTFAVNPPRRSSLARYPARAGPKIADGVSRWMAD